MTLVPWLQAIFPSNLVGIKIFKLKLYLESPTSSITGSRATTNMLEAPGLLITMVDFLLLRGVSFT